MDNPQQAQTVWAYMAGIIDGEGCISISKYSTCRTYKVELIVVQKQEAIILWLHRNISSFRKPDIVKRYKGFSKGSSYWRWSISGADALRVLKNCVPYLVEKKNQAELAIELLETKTKNKGRRGEDFNVLKRHAEIFEKVKTLKRFGAVAETECVNPEKGSDSPNYNNGKVIEIIRNNYPPQLKIMFN